MLDLLGRTWEAVPLPQPAPPAGPGLGSGPPPPAQLAQENITVDEAWELFGIGKKRGTRAEVTKRYRLYVAANHPDRPDAPPDAADRLLRANAAFARLERYCRW